MVGYTVGILYTNWSLIYVKFVRFVAPPLCNASQPTTMLMHPQSYEVLRNIFVCAHPHLVLLVRGAIAYEIRFKSIFWAFAFGCMATNEAFAAPNTPSEDFVHCERQDL